MWKALYFWTYRGNIRFSPIRYLKPDRRRQQQHKEQRQRQNKLKAGGSRRRLLFCQPRIHTFFWHSVRVSPWEPICNGIWSERHCHKAPCLPLDKGQAQFSSVQSLSHVWLFATPWTTAHQASLSITNSRSTLKVMSIELVMTPNHLILCHSLLFPPSIFPSIRVFSNESVLCIRWPKNCSFSFNISPSNEYSGLIPFRIDWLDILAVQGTLESLP